MISRTKGFGKVVGCTKKAKIDLITTSAVMCTAKLMGVDVGNCVEARGHTAASQRAF